VDEFFLKKKKSKQRLMDELVCRHRNQGKCLEAILTARGTLFVYQNREYSALQTGPTDDVVRLRLDPAQPAHVFKYHCNNSIWIFFKPKQTKYHPLMSCDVLYQRAFFATPSSSCSFRIYMTCFSLVDRIA
jgi:hypothetical protein